jgi:hypothetical protein
MTVVAGAYLLYKYKQNLKWAHSLLRRDSIDVGVYVLQFAYPPIASRLVQALGCHEVEGFEYLRVDYNVALGTQ